MIDASGIYSERPQYESHWSGPYRQVHIGSGNGLMLSLPEPINVICCNKLWGNCIIPPPPPPPPPTSGKYSSKKFYTYIKMKNPIWEIGQFIFEMFTQHADVTAYNIYACICSRQLQVAKISSGDAQKFSSCMWTGIICWNIFEFQHQGKIICQQIIWTVPIQQNIIEWFSILLLRVRIDAAPSPKYAQFSKGSDNICILWSL